jgi:hypothetical protein
VLGVTQDGDIWSESTQADPYRIMWLLEAYKFELLLAARAERMDASS